MARLLALLSLKDDQDIDSDKRGKVDHGERNAHNSYRTMGNTILSLTIPGCGSLLC